MKTDVLFSRQRETWETPQDFFDAINKEFHFTLDSCALPQSAKCKTYFTPNDDGLLQPWHGNVWCNPPYDREIPKWLSKAAQETGSGNADLVVLLIPARTDTQWFHDYVYQKSGVEVRFIKGRLKFGGSKNNAPFPSMLVIFRKENR